MARIVRLIAPLVALVWAYACGSSLPTPPTGPHPATYTSYMEVPYPPPPARVEVIPPRPRPDAVWVDGEWKWQGKRWVWTVGGWVAVPAGAYFAPWLTYRLDSGKLLFASGAWHARDGRPLLKPAILAPARIGLDEVAPLASTGSTPAPPGSSPRPASSAPPATSSPPPPVGATAPPMGP